MIAPAQGSTTTPQQALWISIYQARASGGGSALLALEAANRAVRDFDRAFPASKAPPAPPDKIESPADLAAWLRALPAPWTMEARQAAMRVLNKAEQDGTALVRLYELARDAGDAGGMRQVSIGLVNPEDEPALFRLRVGAQCFESGSLRTAIEQAYEKQTG
jgi:hypothetical protein